MALSADQTKFIINRLARRLARYGLQAKQVDSADWTDGAFLVVVSTEDLSAVTDIADAS